MSKSRPLSVRVPPEWVQAVDDYAAALGMNRSDLLFQHIQKLVSEARSELTWEPEIRRQQNFQRSSLNAR